MLLTCVDHSDLLQLKNIMLKEMLNVFMYRYWAGYLYLTCELKRRTEAFSTICRLDDISLLEEPDGKTVFLIHSSSAA